MNERFEGGTAPLGVGAPRPRAIAQTEPIEVMDEMAGQAAVTDQDDVGDRSHVARGRWVHAALYFRNCRRERPQFRGRSHPQARRHLLAVTMWSAGQCVR